MSDDVESSEAPPKELSRASATQSVGAAPPGLVYLYLSLPGTPRPRLPEGRKEVAHAGGVFVPTFSHSLRGPSPLSTPYRFFFVYVIPRFVYYHYDYSLPPPEETGRENSTFGRNPWERETARGGCRDGGTPVAAVQTETPQEQRCPRDVPGHVLAPPRDPGRWPRKLAVRTKFSTSFKLH